MQKFPPIAPSETVFDWVQTDSDNLWTCLESAAMWRTAWISLYACVVTITLSQTCSFYFLQSLFFFFFLMFMDSWGLWLIPFIGKTASSKSKTPSFLRNNVNNLRWCMLLWCYRDRDHTRSLMLRMMRDIFQALLFCRKSFHSTSPVSSPNFMDAPNRCIKPLNWAA